MEASETGQHTSDRLQTLDPACTPYLTAGMIIITSKARGHLRYESEWVLEFLSLWVLGASLRGLLILKIKQTALQLLGKNLELR